MEEERISRHEIKQLRKEEKEQEATHKDQVRGNKKRNKNVIKYSLLFLVLVLIGWLAYSLFNQEEGTRFLRGQVHWHATISLETCGEYRSVDYLGSPTNHVGNSLLHTHGDNLYHLEGSPKYVSQTTLGSFFDAIGVKVRNDELFEYKNGDTCPNGSVGRVSMLVNNKTITNITTYAPQDKDSIIISFG